MSVEIVRKGAGKKYPARRLKGIALQILRMLDRREEELSIALVGDADIRKLNAKYRQKDYATDVLSFPMGDAMPEAAGLLGDVVISVEKARRQAHDRGRTLDDEMTTLLIHGILHLLGYDHERSARQARLMGRLERKIHRGLCG